MPVRVRARLWLAGALAALLAAGCSFVDANVGARQDACDRVDGGHLQTAPDTGNDYRLGAAVTSAPPVCEGNSGRTCDDCESAHCCARRSACYADPVCACADLTLDQCIDDAKASPEAELAARTIQCWTAFSAVGTVERARVACRLAWCRVECELP